MRKIAFLLIFGNLLITTAALRAQIVNGSFASGFTGWTQLGSPSVVTLSPPSGATTFALISSTDAAHFDGSPDAAGSDTAADMEASNHLDTTLPNTDIIFAPTDGQAIYQQFTLTAPATLTFEYASSSADFTYLDSVGYVINGTYTPLSNSASFTNVGPISLGAGNYTLGFVAYNTNDNQYSTNLEVSDIALATVPEPATYLLVGCCFSAVLFFSRRFRCA